MTEKCTMCGEPVDGEGIVILAYAYNHETNASELETYRYCSRSCAEDDGWRNCDCCGEWFREDDAIDVGDEVFCGYECAQDSGYEECENCGDWFDSNVDGVCFEHGGDCHSFCSWRCAGREGYIQCDHCGDWMLDDEADWVGGARWCESCYQDYSSYCYGCDERYADDDLYRDDDDGELYCESCYADGASHLHEYGYTPSLVFRGDGDTPYLGVELETDGGNDRRSYCRALVGIDGFSSHFYMTKDSSLDHGVEVTSHPMTLAYHVGIKPMYERIREEAVSHGFRSHDGGRCGLHVHVNRSFFGKSEKVQDAGGYKMMRLLQRFEHAFTVFSRRDDNKWCRYQTEGDYKPRPTEPSIIPKPGKGETSILVKASEMKYERRHEQCLNFQHPNTFEFRIFRGTLKLTTYYACLGMVNGLCHTVKHHGSVWVESVSWYDLMSEVVFRCDEPFAAACLVDYLVGKGLI